MLKNDSTDVTDVADSDRGQVQLPDAISGLIVLVGVAALAPVWFAFSDILEPAAGPFTTLMLQAAIPFFVVLLVLSLGVSARRGGFR